LMFLPSLALELEWIFIIPKEESQNGSPLFVANKSERGVLISLGKIRNVSKCVKTVLSDEKGVSLIEFGLWLALLLPVMVGAGVTLSNSMGSIFSKIGKVIGGIKVFEI